MVVNEEVTFKHIEVRIDLEHLVVGYAGKGICKEIDMEVLPGKLHFIIGRNGVGKSTLLRTIAGLQNPISGEVKLSGESIYSLSPKQRSQHMYYLPGRTSLRSRISVSDFLRVGAGAHGLASDNGNLPERIVAACEEIGISHLLDSSVHEISDGEFQKMMLTLVLLRDPEVLLLDEPLSHLDPPSQGEIMALLIRLAESRIVVVSSHQLTALRNSGSRAYLLNRGGELRDLKDLKSMEDDQIIALYD